MSLLRRTKVPDVVKAVRLSPGERRLGWAVTDGGEPVLATSVGLRVGAAEPLPWHDVERASWQRPELVVVEASPVEGAGPRRVLRLAQEEELADAVRTAVVASVAWSTVVKLAPTGSVRVVGRRRPGQDALDWQLVFAAGTDPQDPALRAQAEAAVLDARRTIG